VQLQSANNTLKDWEMQAQDDVTNAAMKVASAGAQAILGNTPTVSHLSLNIKAAEPESFDGSRDKMEQFVQAICISHNGD